MSDALKSRPRSVGGVRHDGATRWYINPDGPEAANYIEKLEAALQRANANVEEYERKFYLGTDRIEKLEADLETATMKRLLDSDRIEKLEAALREIDIACDYSGSEYVCRGIARKALEGKDD